MRLDQAMRIGAKMSGQTTGTILEQDGRTCALGAVAQGAEFALDACKDVAGNVYDLPDEVFVQWPELTNTRALCPVEPCGKDSRAICGMIIHLNDFHDWSREAIADFIQHALYPETLGETPAEIVEESVAETVKA